jgi:HlyD family secretion protein
LEVARADEASAKADVLRAEADLAFNDSNLSKAIIKSPINGIVLARHVELGQTVAASLQTPVMFTIAEDLTRMKLHVDVDEADFGKVRAGQSATFTVDAYPDLTFSAKVTEVRYSPKEVQGVVTYETLLSVDNPGLSLIPGMTATAEITVKEIEGALLIPNAVLRFTPPAISGGKKKNKGLLGALLPRRPRRKPSRKGGEELWKSNERVVWTLKENKPVSVTVSIGDTDGIVTEVLSGDIEEGQPLLTEMVIQKK